MYMCTVFVCNIDSQGSFHRAEDWLSPYFHHPISWHPCTIHEHRRRLLEPRTATNGIKKTQQAVELCTKNNVIKKNKDSVTGNRTPVSRVTGGDTYHYTITELPEQAYLILAFVTVASQRLLREVASSDLELESQLVNGQVVLPSVVL